eukprot:scaffold4511_cov171-Amphora_coffeaeformis.AAC.16
MSGKGTLHTQAPKIVPFSPTRTLTRYASAPSGRASNASFVGAKTVKGPALYQRQKERGD